VHLSLESLICEDPESSIKIKKLLLLEHFLLK